MTLTSKNTLIKIRVSIVFFMIALVLSGITAFPIETEVHWLLRNKNLLPGFIEPFITTINEAITKTNAEYPMLAYGYDWLAFAHLVIALMFVGPLKDPIKNCWVIEWAMIACIAVIPLALIAGPIRGIPLYWRLIDCSFGVIGILPLVIVRRWIKKLELISMK